MTIIDNSKEENVVSIYGASGWNTLNLLRVQDNKEIVMPLIDVSNNDRIGMFTLKFSDELEPDTSVLDGYYTLYNLIPGRYEWEAFGARGILLIEGNKTDNIVYEQETNKSKIYQPEL